MLMGGTEQIGGHWNELGPGKGLSFVAMGWCWALGGWKGDALVWFGWRTRYT